jgi:hypothetical protein
MAQAYTLLEDGDIRPAFQLLEEPGALNRDNRMCVSGLKRPFSIIADIAFRTRLSPVTETSNNWQWGCATLALLGLALIASGWELVGRTCIFATFALLLVTAISKARYELAVDPIVSRDARPRAFWAIVLANFALGVAAMIMLVGEVRAPTA